jgi:hypothetical protein
MFVKQKRNFQNRIILALISKLSFLLEFPEVCVCQNSSKNGSEIAEHREKMIVDSRLAFIVQQDITEI